jgi:cytochrome c2
MRRTAAVVALAVFAAAFAAVGQSKSGNGAGLAKAAIEAKQKTFTGDAQAGWDLFREKNCIRCHAVWGQGGEVGPDLGRTRTLGHVTAGQLAGMMWNHVPRMWEKMEEGGMHLTPISSEEMSHLFAFLLFIRYAEEPGDPAEGKRVLTKHGCDSCHAIEANGGTVGPDLANWSRFVNPVVWAQKMWSHALEMQEVMNKMGVAWPEFSDSDLNNIVAFIRSQASGEGKDYLEPGSTARGQELFDTRGCASCHTLGTPGGIGPDLQRTELPDTLSGIASRMWNHAPKMLQKIRSQGGNGNIQDLQAQEMVDIITYLLTRRYFLAEGDPKVGWKVFFSKQCVTCHGIDDWGGNVGPKLNPIRGNASPVLMAHVMWSSGPVMLTEMADRGIPWPQFEGSEMADLIAFFNEDTR